MPTKKSAATSIDSLRHTDKRANIPTEELRDFVADDERAPKTVRYPRDPSLDPQLVWKGKEEQDAADLAVPAVPIYIQEKIQPQAIIENVRAQARSNDFSRSGADDSSRHYDQPRSSPTSTPSRISRPSPTSTITRTTGRTESSWATRCW